MNRSYILGILIGTAVGDSVGLPAEGICRRRNQKIFRGHWHQGLLWRYGMISDDTEHTIFVAQCLIAYPDSPHKYIRRLAWCLRWWLLSLPAGVGLATLKSIVKLWLGFNPRHSGVYSAGNGAAMKSAIIGAFFAHYPDKLAEYVSLSTRITHIDPRAFIGARAIASLTAWIIRDNFTQPPEIDILSTFLKQIGSEDQEWILLVNKIKEGLMGATVGIQGIPQDWIKNLRDYPRNIQLLEKIAQRLSTTIENNYQPSQPVSYNWWWVLPRNIIFLLIVLSHGFRRLFPPYIMGH